MTFIEPWILFVWLSIIGSSKAITTAEFKSKENCELALKQFKEARVPGDGFCAKK